ncbi:Cysteine protease [Thalictrum thalictroides]|uniref:Cysteine protease n=1 Tax=Thalictrum thalictroides TaxID=46969 RepID=A0A7J6VQV4_THATH|nr:Cysteine protease [Thalictrum thalictroides]
MKGLHDKRVFDLKQTSTDSPSNSDLLSSTTDHKTNKDIKSTQVSSWSSILAPTFLISETYIALRRIVSGGSMRRLQEYIVGSGKTSGVSNSSSDIWLLGVCYKVSSEGSSNDDAFLGDGLVEFSIDFSSRIWITYRKGFDTIGDSKFTSDVNWGCMLRSSQMLISQALLFHHLGRSWRKPLEKPFSPKYIEILDLFGDSEGSPFSIHNLLQVGKAYGLAPGSWIGPYAMCRTWETLAHSIRQKDDKLSLPMVVYCVSGDENGERGGAPTVCIEDVIKLCNEFSEGQVVWTPILLLVPLVLGLDKVNPRYFSSLWATFTFPQSLGILGGKPGVSTYIVGVQDDMAFYLDPHEVQTVIDVKERNSEVDTSSYHCNVVRHLPLDMIDPSLAIGFYCRDKDDFDNFCDRAAKLADASNGAPLFTISASHEFPKTVPKDTLAHSMDAESEFELEKMNESEISTREDDWQFL